MTTPDRPNVQQATCRQCRSGLGIYAERCSGCGCPAPFACAVCQRPLSSVSVIRPASRRHPHGSFTPEGLPLCHLHRLTRCDGCGDTYPREKMERRVVGQRADTHLREGKPPRIEDVEALLCDGCQAAAIPEEAFDGLCQARSRGTSEMDGMAVAGLLVLAMVFLLLVLLMRR